MMHGSPDRIPITPKNRHAESEDPKFRVGIAFTPPHTLIACSPTNPLLESVRGLELLPGDDLSEGWSWEAWEAGNVTTLEKSQLESGPVPSELSNPRAQRP